MRGVRIALHNKAKLAHPTRFERVTFAFGGRRSALCLANHCELNPLPARDVGSPVLGGSGAWPAIVRRDREIETASHVGNPGGSNANVGWTARRSRCSGSLAPTFCEPPTQFLRSGIAKFVLNLYSPDTNKNTNIMGRCRELRHVLSIRPLVNQGIELEA